MKKRGEVTVNIWLKKDGQYVRIESLSKEELKKIATEININGMRRLGYEVEAPG